jgi:hypothetical protein
MLFSSAYTVFATIYRLVCNTTLTQHLEAVGFEVLTPVVMNNSVFWDVTPCSPLKDNRLFGRPCHPHLQGRRISRARNQQSSASRLLACWFLAELIFSNLKMESICSSKTSVDTQRTTRRYNPEDDTFECVATLYSFPSGN